MEKKESRRIQMTRRLLKDSLLELLQTKNIRHITVTELCENADLNRSTFYAYYESPYDLMMSMERDIVKDSIAMLEGCPDFPVRKKMLYLLEKHLLYVKAHIREFQAFSSDIGEDFNLPIKTMEIIVHPYLKFLAKKSDLSEYEKNQISIFCTFGVIGIVKEWIREKTPVSAGVISQEICQIIENAFISR